MNIWSKEKGLRVYVRKNRQVAKDVEQEGEEEKSTKFCGAKLWNQNFTNYD